ncbi:MAG TPA: zinc ribbon domain-containing protein [Holophagaceae bacterium]|nr:zinc ribbon domain-containing protein [Holophagaceae bacterium]
MTNLPRSLEGYVGGVGLLCSVCGQKVVEAVVPEEGQPYVCPSCAAPATFEEDELTRAALSDPEAFPPLPEDRPSIWRPLFLVALAIVALAVLFFRA